MYTIWDCQKPVTVGNHHLHAFHLLQLLQWLGRTPNHTTCKFGNDQINRFKQFQIETQELWSGSNSNPEKQSGFHLYIQNVILNWPEQFFFNVLNQESRSQLTFDEDGFLGPWKRWENWWRDVLWRENWLTPRKLTVKESKKWRFGSDDFSLHFEVI